MTPSSSWSCSLAFARSYIVSSMRRKPLLVLGVWSQFFKALSCLCSNLSVELVIIHHTPFDGSSENEFDWFSFLSSVLFWGFLFNFAYKNITPPPHLRKNENKERGRRRHWESLIVFRCDSSGHDITLLVMTYSMFQMQVSLHLDHSMVESLILFLHVLLS